MSKTPAKRIYAVHSQIEADGVTYPAGSQAELTQEQAASVGDCIKLIEPAAAPAATAPAAAKTAKAD